MSGLDGYRNRIDSLAEAHEDSNEASQQALLAYAALSLGHFAAAQDHIARARRHLDALALKIKTEAASHD